MPQALTPAQPIIIRQARRLFWGFWKESKALAFNPGIKLPACAHVSTLNRRVVDIVRAYLMKGRTVRCSGIISGHGPSLPAWKQFWLCTFALSLFLVAPEIYRRHLAACNMTDMCV